MNIQNLMNQLGKSSNPMQMLMNTLNPSQIQLLNNFKNVDANSQAEQIAKMCNEKGLSKQDLQNIINTINGKK